jgi:hypothetical protein
LSKKKIIKKRNAVKYLEKCYQFTNILCQLKGTNEQILSVPVFGARTVKTHADQFLNFNETKTKVSITRKTRVKSYVNAKSDDAFQKFECVKVDL